MDLKRLQAVIARESLGSGRPVDQALREVLPRTGKPVPVQLQVALGDFAEGRLDQGLRRLCGLGLDPVFAEAAALKPELSRQVDLALGRLPVVAQVAAPVRTAAAYLGLVVVLQLLVVLLLSQKVLPLLAGLAATTGAGPLPGAALLPVLGAGALIAGVAWLELRAVGRLVAAARAYAAADALVRGGAVPEAVALLRRLRGPEALPGIESPAAGHPDLLSTRTLDDARRRAARAEFVLKAAGGLALVASGALVLVSVYLPVFRLGGSVLD